MSDGKLLIALGLGLEITATLFISMDAFRSQRQTVRIYQVLDWITSLEVIGLRARPATESADRLAAQAEEGLRTAGVPEGKERQVAAQQGLEAIQGIVLSAEEEAGLRNREIFQGELKKVADDFTSRKYFIQAAIAFVLIGGLFELVGTLMEV